MKRINVAVEFYDRWTEIVLVGDQEELYDKYMADPTDENRQNFVSSIEEEIALNISFGVSGFYEDVDDDD